MFGLHRFREPPVAEPPTLTLYVRHKAVDMEKLIVPGNVEVTVGEFCIVSDRTQ